MTHLRLSCAVLALLLLSACGDDISDVGLGLVDEQAGAPETLVFPLGSFSSEPVDDFTGNTGRILAGRTADPVLGTLTTEGFFDFGAALLTEDYRDGSITSATLTFEPDYVYGDTTAPITLALYDVASEVTTLSATADTDVPRGDLVQEFTFSPTDTLVTLDLPQDWLAANDTTLRSTTFATSFHGFLVAPVSGDAIVGFDVSDLELRSESGNDNVTFVINLTDAATSDGKTLTRVERVGTPRLPDDVLLVQDGLGPAIELTFDLDDVLDTAVNRAQVDIVVDTLLATTDLPTGYVRPSLSTLDLFGVLDDGGLVFITSGFLDDGVLTLEGRVLREALQALALGTESFDRFELRPPIDNATTGSTINPLFVYGPSSPDRAPRIFITVSPLSR